MSTYHLTATGSTTCDELPHQFDPPCLWVHCAFPHEVIDRQLDGFLGSHTLCNHVEVSGDLAMIKTYITHNQLRPKTTVETNEPFVMEDLPHTIQTVLVQQLSDDSAPLILHPGLMYDDR